MADSDFSNPTPQFGTAEYAPKSGTDVCKSCNQGISGQYFRVNGSLACARCVGQLKNQIPKDTHALFVRGLVFGFGGAILGLILYSGSASSPVLLLATFRWLSVGSLPKPSRSVRAVLAGAALKGEALPPPPPPSPLPPLHFLFLSASPKDAPHNRTLVLPPPPNLFLLTPHPHSY